MIALFNPEMAREWIVMHEAELGFDWGAADNRLHWYMIAPRDDGTLAAAITAERLSGGATEPPLPVFEPEVTVERLGRAGAPVAAQSGDGVLVASARDALATAVRRLERGLPAVSGATDAHSESSGDGVLFDLAPASLTAPGPERLALRRAVVLVRGLALERIEGCVAVKADRLEIDVRSSRSGVPAGQATAEVAVDPAWLRWVPAAGIMGVASVAFAPEATFWDSAFTLADGIDRADPTHANAAPLRARLNLLAAGVGARLEVDLWPHLRGLTACVMADPHAPGSPTGALVVLHLDGERSADRIATDVLPRLARLSTGLRPSAAPPGQAAPGEPRRIGVAAGKPLAVAQRGNDALLAWGDQVLDRALELSKTPDRSVAPLCATWTTAGKPAPRRLGAFWPARCWSPAPLLTCPRRPGKSWRMARLWCGGAGTPPPSCATRLCTRICADGPPLSRERAARSGTAALARRLDGRRESRRCV